MKSWFILIFTFLLFSTLSGQNERSTRLEKKAIKRSGFIPGIFAEWKHTGGVNVDSIRVYPGTMTLNYYFNPSTTHIPLRTELLNNLHSRISKELGRRFRDYNIHLIARGKELEEYIPNAYRPNKSQYDVKRMSSTYTGPPLVTRQDQPASVKGLAGHHIAIWPSHGLFFDQQLDRWQWQRARLWQTVEDIFPYSFTSAYLVPMLENAGAVVLLPRERDTQTHEVVVDNNFSTGKSELIKNGKWDSTSFVGFQWADSLHPGQNPFQMGTSLSAPIQDSNVSAVYIPDIPETGDYAVTVSWAKTGNCNESAVYKIQYDGGTESFIVNQCMGTGTWIYLGTFHFKKGLNPDEGSVTVSGNDDTGILSTDAVRFGGGMGNVVRKPGSEMMAKLRSSAVGSSADVQEITDTAVFHYMLSGKPRWMEGSRYYLQYAGMPDTLTYSLNAGKNDYNDDYMSRPEWVNYLVGSSRPQYSSKYSSGCNIPVDLSLAFHTDAGVTGGDTVIGTLGIYSTTRNDGIFPDGRSKLTSRDLTDMVQTQIVNDIRKVMDPKWTRRGLWDREYSEAWRPVVPSMLLELLSHQNLADMRMGLDPRFKFIASRAIYKGILRFLSAEQGFDPVIQPLSPDHMAIEWIGDRKIKLSWQPVSDSLEPSAVPDGYKIYQKKEDSGFAPGIYTTENNMIIELPGYNSVFSFRVTAVNAGGESFPGETLSAGILPGDNNPVLIVNGFDRISGPSFFDKADMAGISWWDDEGVPYLNDFSFTGYQYDFNRNSAWINDDNQGWGASSAALETVRVTGNSFSYPYVHGKAILNAGHSFVSVSDEVFESTNYHTEKFPAVDVIFGEERGAGRSGSDTVKEFRLFTPGFMKTLGDYLRSGGKVFLSGAYIGTDMSENQDSSAIHFAADILHYTWRTNHASTNGLVYATDHGAIIFPKEIKFNTDFDTNIYRVESPDAIEPYGNNAFRICRYVSGNTSAGIAYSGACRLVVLGFPFETITDEGQRIDLMDRILKFLILAPASPGQDIKR